MPNWRRKIKSVYVFNSILYNYNKYTKTEQKVKLNWTKLNRLDLKHEYLKNVGPFWKILLELCSSRYVHIQCFPIITIELLRRWYYDFYVKQKWIEKNMKYNFFIARVVSEKITFKSIWQILFCIFVLFLHVESPLCQFCAWLLEHTI